MLLTQHGLEWRSPRIQIEAQDQSRKSSFMPVRQLPEQVVNRIAAGEVIERPASVVKELVENAIDAGATSILVEIEDGGREPVPVLDACTGIPPADLPLAFAEHATSKIRDDDDLFNIATMGF